MTDVGVYADELNCSSVKRYNDELIEDFNKKYPYLRYAPVRQYKIEHMIKKESPNSPDTLRRRLEEVKYCRNREKEIKRDARTRDLSNLKEKIQAKGKEAGASVMGTIDKLEKNLKSKGVSNMAVISAIVGAIGVGFLTGNKDVRKKIAMEIFSLLNKARTNMKNISGLIPKKNSFGLMDLKKSITVSAITNMITEFLTVMGGIPETLVKKVKPIIKDLMESVSFKKLIDVYSKMTGRRQPPSGMTGMVGELRAGAASAGDRQLRTTNMFGIPRGLVIANPPVMIEAQIESIRRILTGIAPNAILSFAIAIAGTSAVNALSIMSTEALIGLLTRAFTSVKNGPVILLNLINEKIYKPMLKRLMYVEKDKKVLSSLRVIKKTTQEINKKKSQLKPGQLAKPISKGKAKIIKDDIEKLNNKIKSAADKGSSAIDELTDQLSSLSLTSRAEEAERLRNLNDSESLMKRAILKILETEGRAKRTENRGKARGRDDMELLCDQFSCISKPFKRRNTKSSKMSI